MKPSKLFSIYVGSLSLEDPCFQTTFKVTTAVVDPCGVGKTSPRTLKCSVDILSFVLYVFPQEYWALVVCIIPPNMVLEARDLLRFHFILKKSQ